MTLLTEGSHAGEAIVSEANGSRSREAITVLSGQVLVACAVVGIVTASGKYATYDNAAVDGTETAAGVLFDAVDATGADADGVVLVRDCELNLSELQFDVGQAQAAQDAAVVDLLALGIVTR